MKDFKQNKAGYYYSDQCNLAEFQEIINQKLTAPKKSRKIKA